MNINSGTSELPKPSAAIVDKPNFHNIVGQSISRKIPLTRWPEFHVWPSVAGLRHLVFNCKRNGFDKVLRRSGRRILIDEISFFSWLDKQGGK